MTRLFEPLQLGRSSLQHRVALAPLTRMRSPNHIPPIPLAVEYYSQRAAVSGTLLLTEATFISPRAGGYPNVPGIWSPAQIAAWRQITDGVHAQGSFIYCQLWALGRAAEPDVLAKDGHRVVSSSARAMDDKHATPAAMTEDEIQAFVGDYAQAARNAVEAGFDGVEVHGANGYLIDQFTQDVCNERTDRWGGSVENRARFGLEVTKAVIEAIGADRTGYRISPYSRFQAMGMDKPEGQFTYLIEQLSALKLAYLHAVEPRIDGNVERAVADEGKSLQFVLNAWGSERPVLVAGGYKSENAISAVEKQYKDSNVVVAIGRYFISNPDLPLRIQKGIELMPYNRETFYTPGAKGYTDYPFSKEFGGQTGAIEHRL